MDGRVSTLDTIKDFYYTSSMKILVASDVHGNLEALEEVLQDDYDYFVYLGDVCDYGPDPEPVLEILKNTAHVFILGNHDNAVAHGVDCRCSTKLHEISVETRKYTLKQLKRGDIEYLKTLYPSHEFTYDDIKFAAFHATPRDPLFSYLYPCDDEEKFTDEMTIQHLYIGTPDLESADIILVGHSHYQYYRRFGKKFVLNPGSVGQPRDGIPYAAYAIIEDGNIILKRKKYDIKKTLKKIGEMPIPQKHINKLKKILKTGSV